LMISARQCGPSGVASNPGQCGFKFGAVSTPAPVQIRRGDRVMCMRFWSENTRESAGAVHQRLLARAFHPKARSHDPITTPNRVGSKPKEACTQIFRYSEPQWHNQHICAASGWGEPPDFWYPSMRGVAPAGCGAARPTTAAWLNDSTSAA
jgi:hypothetical protein